MSSMVEIYQLFKHKSQNLGVIFDTAPSLSSDLIHLQVLSILPHKYPPNQLTLTSVNNTSPSSHHLFLDHSNLPITTLSTSTLVPSSLLFLLKQEPPFQNTNWITSTSSQKPSMAFYPAEDKGNTHLHACRTYLSSSLCFPLSSYFSRHIYSHFSSGVLLQQQ